LMVGIRCTTPDWVFVRSNLPAASGRGRCRILRTNGAKVVESKTRYRWNRPSPRQRLVITSPDSESSRSCLATNSAADGSPYLPFRWPIRISFLVR
jgi:hypothetical protein